MRGKILLVWVAVVLAVALGASAFASDYRIGGMWLTQGTGYAKKGALRVDLEDKGWLDVITTVSGDLETITAYRVYGELTASKLGINAWSYQNEITLGVPVPIEDFNPSMSEPFRLPSITIDKLTYTLVLTSVYSGTLELTGYVDIDVVGECEVHANNALWKQGTERPDIPDEGSGCSAGAAGGLAALFVLAGAFLRRGHRG